MPVRHPFHRTTPLRHPIHPRPLRTGALLFVAGTLALVGCTSDPRDEPTATPTTASASPSNPGDTSPDAGLSYSADGTDVTLVTAGFTHPPAGYRVTDGNDELDAPSALSAAPDNSELYLVMGTGPDTLLVGLRDGMDRWDVLAGGTGSPVQQPVDVSAGAPGTVTVLDGARQLWTGRGDGTWTRMPAPTGDVVPTRMAAGPDGTLAVVDHDRSTVATTTDNGATWDVVDRTTGSFDDPVDVAVGADGTVVVLNAGHAGLSIRRPGASSWDVVPGDGAGWTSPTAVTVGPAGDLIVADPGAGTLSRSTDGGLSWTAADGVDAVAGLSVGPDGLLYLADGINAIVSLEPTPPPVGTVTVSRSGNSATVTWVPRPGQPTTGLEYVVALDYEPTPAELSAQRSVDATATASPDDSPDSDGPDGAAATQVVGPATTTVTFTDLPAGRAGTVHVVARNGAGYGTAAGADLAAS